MHPLLHARIKEQCILKIFFQSGWNFNIVFCSPLPVCFHLICSLSVVRENWPVCRIVVFPEKKQDQYTEGIVLSRREMYAHLTLVYRWLLSNKETKQDWAEKALMSLCQAKQDDQNTQWKIANSRVLELLECFYIASHNITCQEDCVGAFKNLHM